MANRTRSYVNNLIKQTVGRLKLDREIGKKINPKLSFALAYALGYSTAWSPALELF